MSLADFCGSLEALVRITLSFALHAGVFDVFTDGAYGRVVRPLSLN